MKDTSVFFEEIIENNSSCSKKVKSIASKLSKSCVAGKFSLSTVSCLDNLSQLAYLLYIHDKPETAKEICKIVENENYIPTKSALWCPITQLLVLLLKINGELSDTINSCLITDKIKRSYEGAERALERRLNGSLLCTEEVKEALINNDIASANEYRFGMLSELCFIHALEKDDSKKKGICKDIQDIKAVLRDCKF